jgi:hypothetical protein
MISALFGLALAAPDASTAHDFVRVDARGAAQSIDAVSHTIGALAEVDRARVAAALRELAGSDPYTGAALQLPFALDAAVQQIPDDRFDPLVRSDWVFLQTGLAAHVEVLTSLEVEAGGSTDGALRSRIAGIVPAAGRLEAPARARIEALSDEVEALTGVARPCPRGPHALFPGQPWTLGMQLGGWHDVLRRVEPFAADPATREQVGRLISLLDAYGEASMATVYAPVR